MPSVMKAMKGNVPEPKAKDIITDSKLEFDERLEQARLFGEFYPVTASVNFNEDVINIDFDLPKVRTEKRKMLDSAPAQFSIKHRSDGIYTVSLKVKGFGLVYNDYIEMGDDVLKALKGEDGGSSKESCAIFNTRMQRLMGLLYETGDYINFRGGSVDVEKPYPILELLGLEMKGQLTEHVADESEITAEIVEQPSEEVMEAEVIDDHEAKVVEDKLTSLGYEKEPDITTAFSRDEAKDILEIGNSGIYCLASRNPGVKTESGEYTASGIARYAIGSKGSRLELDKRLRILKKVGIEAENLKDAAEKVKEKYGIDVEPGLGRARKTTPKPQDDGAYRLSEESLSEELNPDEIAAILGTKMTSVRVDISRGYIKGKTRKHVADRIATIGRRTDEERLGMYNKLFKDEGVTFENIDQVYVAMPELKKKL